MNSVDDLIPAFHIAVRSGRNGWQTVAVAHTEAEARRLFAEWLVKTQRQRYMSLYKAESDIAGAWAVIQHYSPAA
jgi:hypothetical protein